VIRLLLSLFLLTSAAEADAATLRERLTPDVLAVAMPGAERLGPEQGSPPSIAVYKGNEVVAYLFSTLDVVRASGYSSVPFDVIAGVDVAGRITGAKVIFHAEPYVVNDAIRQPQLDTFLAREAGTSIRGGAAPTLHPDFVAGATDMLARNDRVNNEFYTCPVYNMLIEKHKKIGVYEISPSAMHGIGTPDDLTAYLALQRAD